MSFRTGPHWSQWELTIVSDDSKRLMSSRLVRICWSSTARFRNVGYWQKHTRSLLTQFAGNGKKMPIAAPECRLLRSSARSRDAKHHLRAAVQLDILLGAEQDAGSLSHPGILLPPAHCSPTARREQTWWQWLCCRFWLQQSPPREHPLLRPRTRRPRLVTPFALLVTLAPPMLD